MPRYDNCIAAIRQAAGRDLSDDEVHQIFERIHKSAQDIKAGRIDPADVKLPTSDGFDKPSTGNALIQKAAERAAAEMVRDAEISRKQTALQITKSSARKADVAQLRESGLTDLKAVEKTIVRDYTGQFNVESLEQKVAGYQGYFGRKLLDTWTSLGDDFAGFFQDQKKLTNLVRELRGEDSGDAIAKKGAKAFHETAEEARQVFNDAGGNIGKLDDWGMPQHHSQYKVAEAGRDVWIDKIIPLLDRNRYVDDLGQSWSEKTLSEFLGKAWDTISTNGHANAKPGVQGSGKRANRHAESRQIHFKDAESVISYWQEFGERTAFEILHGHINTMARDIAFIDHFGPNPDMTYRSLRDEALSRATQADPKKTETLEGAAVKLDGIYNYASGKTIPTYREWLKKTADGIANLNVAGKLGGAALASLFGDKPMMEAVSHLNNLSMLKRWRTELALLNPKNASDRALLRQQGLMLDSVRSGLQRFYEGLGQTGSTGKMANAVMRVTGMQAINDIRKGAFGMSLMSAIGNEIKRGADFSGLHESDVRTLRNYGITESDWKIWSLAKLDDLGHGNDAVLTPEAISRISDAELKSEGLSISARRDAIVKLLGAVNTESEFAIVTPGWKERAQFYGDLQRGTVKGEIVRSVLQFKSFPWAMLQRGMDAIGNMETPTSKAAMGAYLMVSTTLAGAMLMQTRDMLTGKDPRSMVGEDAWKFWGAAFLQGGALGIYGDFLYGANHTRYGSGILESLSGPTLGPLLEIGLVQPANAIAKSIDGKETHLGAETLQDLKGFVPGGNIWYTKAALDHLIWQRVMDELSPGYLSNIKKRTRKEYGQDWYWEPGELTPDRGPDLGAAIER